LSQLIEAGYFGNTSFCAPPLAIPLKFEKNRTKDNLHSTLWKKYFLSERKSGSLN